MLDHIIAKFTPIKNDAFSRGLVATKDVLIEELCNGMCLIIWNSSKKKLSFRKSEVQNAHFLAEKLQKHKFIGTFCKVMKVLKFSEMCKILKSHDSKVLCRFFLKLIF